MKTLKNRLLRRVQTSLGDGLYERKPENVSKRIKMIGCPSKTAEFHLLADKFFKRLLFGMGEPLLRSMNMQTPNSLLQTNRDTQLLLAQKGAPC
ncbi:MAG: hypothetical protein ACTTH5_03680 [Wolinella sp.]